MRNALLLATCMGLAAAPAAWADDWKLSGRSGRAQWYIDPATIKIHGDIREAWSLKDQADPDMDGARSAKVLLEYDCQATRSRFTQWIAYQAPMGRGEVVKNESIAGEWGYASPDTVRAALQEAVCSHQ